MGKSCRKILWEIVVGNCCGKILREKFCGKILREIVVRKSCSCGNILWEILVGKSCGKNLEGKGGGEKTNLRKAVIGGNLAFGIG